MNAKNLTILTLITLVVGIMALWLSQPKVAMEDNQPVFPNLMATINDVTAINVVTKNDNFTVMRRGEQQWVLKEKHDYPVSLDKVRSALLGLTDLTTVEAKTATPSLYQKLGVEEVTEKESKSTLLTLKNKEDKPVASIILGNSQPAKNDTTLNEIYVRKPEDKQAWLAQGFLRVERMPLDWIDKRVVDVDGKRIRQVQVTPPEGKPLVVVKSSPTEENYQLQDLPAGAKLKAPYELGQMANVLSYLNINEVMTEAEVAFDEKSTYRTVFTSFDGLEITMTAREKDGKYYAKFAAASVPSTLPPAKTESNDQKEVKSDTADKTAKDPQKSEKSEELPPGMKTAEAVKKEVETLKSLAGWVFEIPKYKMDALMKQPADLIETEKDKTEESLNPNRTPNPSPLLEFGTPKT